MKNTKYLYDERQSPEGMVSVSQLQTYLSCKKKWEYNYVECIKPRIERSYLTIGKLCHEGMRAIMEKLWLIQQEKGGSSTNWYAELLNWGLNVIDLTWMAYMDSIPLLNEEIPDMEQMLKDAKSVFAQAFRELNPFKYEVVSVVKHQKLIPALELHFKVPCPPTKGLHGYIDAILRDRETGFIWCTDYKFRKSLSPDDEEAFNIQNAVYSYACAKMGIDITGTMTWQHSNSPAADPQILKTGAISRAKIRTTWEHYAEFCLANGEDPDDYREEMQEKLADIEWYRATLEYRNEETVQTIWKECVLPVARAVKAAHGKKAVNYRSLYPWNCKMCQYQSLCQAELRDYDTAAIREREYVKRENTSPTHEKVSSLPSDDSDE